MSRNTRMKATRVLRGYTQLRLGEKVGKQEIEISRIETGRRQPDADTKRRIAEALQVPVAEIFSS